MSRRTVGVRRFGRERIGIAVLVVLALVCAVLIGAVAVRTRTDAAIAAREAAGYVPPSLSTPPAVGGPVVAVIGDAMVSDAGTGVREAQLWPAVLADTAEVSVVPLLGGGYVTKTAAADTFIKAAQRVPTNAAVVVFIGGTADRKIASLSVAQSATRAFAAAVERAPGARIVVVGPVIGAGTTAADLASLRTTLRSSARIAELSWVDPIAGRWLDGGATTASTSDLTAADERVVAQRLRPVVEKALKVAQADG